MPCWKRWVLTAAVLILGVSPSALAQPEVVPSDHPVYDFLHQQRVAGNLPGYRHESLPLGRADIQRHLATVRSALPAATGGTGYWLAEFSREFDEPRDAIESMFGYGRVGIPREADTEKFLFYSQGEAWRLAVSGRGTIEYRTSEGALRPDVLPVDASYSGLAGTPQLTLEGNYRGRIGFYSRTFNGFQVTGDNRVLQADPTLASLYYVGIRDTPDGSFDRTTASVRAATRTFSAEIAHARPLVGAAFGRPLILAGNADNFSFVKLGVDTRLVQYQFMHSALGDQSRSVEGENGQGLLLGPERYMALHRLAVNPARWLGLAFTEMVVYGNRGPELAYLNPVNPFKTAEHALWDRDNTLFAIEAVVRPVAGVEAHATFLADDLDFGEFGDNSYNNKWAVQAGLGTAFETPVGAALGYVEYTRTEPFIYTHRFLLEGSYYNSYTHNGFGLGHPIGPNADQIEVGLEVWLPFRLRATVRGRYARRGENFTDEDGTLINVGGNITNGDQPPFSEPTKEFLRGTVQQGPGATLDVTWEPLNEVGVALHLDYQQWDNDPNRLFARSSFFIDL
ncbi:MAG: capsule assembly Wzi family protein [Bacteroidota bacterium]